jgi:hypothetical protein
LGDGEHAINLHFIAKMRVNKMLFHQFHVPNLKVHHKYWFLVQVETMSQILDGYLHFLLDKATQKMMGQDDS